MIRTREKHQASLTSVLVGAFAAVLIGAIAGVAYEISRPPLLGGVGAASEDERAITPVFLPGQSNGAGDWNRMLRRIVQGENPGPSLEFNEAELNQIAREYLNFTLGKEQVGSGEKNPFFAFLPDTPNFRISDSLLQCVLPFEMIVPGFEGKGWLVVIGRFAENPDGPGFAVEEAWINSARIPPVVAERMVTSLVGSVRRLTPDSILFTAWERIESIRLSDDTAILTAR